MFSVTIDCTVRSSCARNPKFDASWIGSSQNFADRSVAVDMNVRRLVWLVIVEVEAVRAGPQHRRHGRILTKSAGDANATAHEPREQEIVRVHIAQLPRHHLLNLRPQLPIRHRPRMVPGHFPRAIQQHQRRRRRRPISIEVVLADRHRHVEQPGIKTMPHRVDVLQFIARRRMLQPAPCSRRVASARSPAVPCRQTPNATA